MGLSLGFSAAPGICLASNTNPNRLVVRLALFIFSEILEYALYYTQIYYNIRKIYYYTISYTVLGYDVICYIALYYVL